MSGLGSSSNSNYGAVASDEHEVSWNEEEGRASIFHGHDSQSRSSLRESFIMQVTSLGSGLRQSIRDSSGNLIRTSVRLTRQSITLSFGGRQCSVRMVGGTASIPTEFFNLVKNLVGAGMLAIPVSSYSIDGYWKISLKNLNPLLVSVGDRVECECQQ